MLLALSAMCVVFVTKTNRMIAAYMDDRREYYPEANAVLCDVDLWVPPFAEAPPVFLFTYRSEKYPSEHWWAVLSLTGTDQGCGQTDHIPYRSSHIVR